ncbi:MAG: CHAT domain-containing protein [Bacteroidetes bacterium]|nr:CHAT domain-containing protein [Bacteroidota bacterium]
MKSFHRLVFSIAFYVLICTVSELYAQNNDLIPATDFNHKAGNPSGLTDTLRRSLSARLNLAVTLLVKGEYNRALDQLVRGITMMTQGEHKDDGLLVNFYFQTANCYLLKEDPANGIKFYQLTLQFCRQDKPMTAIVNLNLGDLYFLSQDYDNAIRHYRKAIVILEETNRDARKMTEAIMNIGSSFAGKREYQRAIQYYSMAEGIYKKYLTDSSTMGHLYINLASVYFRNNDFNRSQKYIRLALLYTGTGNKHNTQDLSFIFKTIASLYLLSGRPDSSFYYLQKARFSLFQQENYKKEDVSEIYRLMGNCTRDQSRWQEALPYYDTAIQQLSLPGSSGFTETKSIMDNLPFHLRRLRILKDRVFAEYQLTIHQKSKGKELSDAWYDCISLIKLMNVISGTLGQEGTRLIFNESYVELYSMAMNTGYKLYDPLNDTISGKLFELSEQSRSNVLLASLNEEKAKKLAGIPDSLIDKEKRLRSEIIKLTGESLSGQPVLSEKGNKTRLLETERITDLTIEHDSLIRNLERSFQEYNRLKHQDQQISKRDIQKTLAKDEYLLEYFTTDTNLFIFLLSRDKMILQKHLINESFHYDIKRYCRLLSNADIRDFIGTGMMLYKELIAPVRQYPGDNSKLIIIPDDNLYMVPFESLISDTSGNDQYKRIHYLIRDFDIGYHYSATLWAMERGETVKVQVQKTESPVFIGFSPSFNAANVELPYAEDEIKQVAALLKDHDIAAVSVIRDKATESYFKKASPYFSWIHLATHSIIDLNDPGRSGLKFSQPGKFTKNNPGDNGILYFDEIYQLKLKADLVVLSSCASGTGKLIRSEGLMALTRGFLYAGASNILFSLWNVTDRNTRDFMVGFYGEILSGKSYTAALRAEKLKMLSEPETSLPLIWAPFVMIGR